MIRAYIIAALIQWPICYGWYRIGRRHGYDERQREVVEILRAHTPE